ncbi:histidine phosphatase family protein [Aureimonas leprariae]|uniref:Histidine phosphatase family protein n=1 Tax=Plantimonas leprariae TaxID=2615207 RepID=A0A7V7PM09_9HYPH|nr:histidine phosphatase family protein [Aureimonas leprariae]KAB0677757.1 histidine phosphatase family protein [Aureimonas leprariae]
MPDFLLLRHAATDWNERGLIQGRADVPLSPAGRDAASGWRLPPFAAGWTVVASPLGRARETAEAMGLVPRLDPAFIEMDWGASEGRTLAELRAEGGEPFAANEVRGLDFRSENGESPREVGARALEGLRLLGGNSAIVTHKGVIRALLASATGWDMRGKAPVRLLPGTAHHFRLNEGLSLVQANIPLGEVS